MVVEVNARLVFNPSAGMRDERADIQRAAETLRARGWSIEICETARSGDAVRFARAAAAQHLDAVLAAGGDGTMNEVANGLVDTATALGVLPSGTANAWAKEMGLPLGDLVTAARRLADAEVRAIDVGEVRGPTMAPRVFVLWSGVGLDALITSDIEPQRDMKRRLGALMFWLVGIRDAWSYRGKRATLVVGEKRISRRVILALAANAQLYGGIVKIAPNARVDDGLLDFVVFKGTGFWATAWHILRVFFGAHLRDPQVEIYSVASVTVDGKNLRVHVDAEPIGFAPVEIRVRPRALRVLVPKTANQSLFVRM
ncbi:MAG: diacylglycerol kinase family lipid kinase [Chloroflexota bacterium]|nr:diacylglycerol kinase family lipid kinase [Chloroflexota bacterium]